TDHDAAGPLASAGAGGEHPLLRVVPRRDAPFPDLQRPAAGSAPRRGGASTAARRDHRPRQAGFGRLRPDAISLLMESPFDVVTGAFSFTGRFIARRLLAEEHRV